MLFMQHIKPTFPELNTMQWMLSIIQFSETDLLSVYSLYHLLNSGLGTILPRNIPFAPAVNLPILSLREDSQINFVTRNVSWTFGGGGLSWRFLLSQINMNF